MLRLSGTDTMMLAAETPGWHFHVGGLSIIECDADPHATLLRIAEEVERRLPLAPKFTWKLREVPFGLDLPVWVPDDDFDINRHVHVVSLRPPAGRHEVAELAGRIMSSQLDRRYPLWQMYLIEGLANNRVATLLKTHHCMMDGVSGASLATVLSDVERHPKDLPRPSADDASPGESPSRLSLLASALPRMAERQLRRAQFGLGLAGRLGTFATYSADGGDLYRYTGAPRTSFNGPVGKRRAFGFSSVSFDDIRSLREKFDVKINDVALALCAGALRNYLLINGETIDSALVAGIPVSTRDGDTTMNNQIGTMCVKLATHIDDPIARLMQIHQNAHAAKEMHQAMRAHPLPSMGDVAAPALLQSVVRALYESRIMSRMPTPMNALVSNVAGPPFDLFIAGGKVLGIFPTSIIAETMALNITLFTYGGRMDFGVSADPDAVPDPFLVADGIPAALRELLAAAHMGEPTPVIDAFGEPSHSPTTRKTRPQRRSSMQAVTTPA
jgi:WS/DGAT/MGAT family acyltransferase